MDSYYIKTGIERLKQLKPDFEFKKAFFENVKSTDNICNKMFYYNKYNEYKTSNFNPSIIAGTKHIDYNNKMWIEMLGSLKRFRIGNIDTEISLSNYINNTEDVCLAKYGDEFYIISGNHRLCIAKFMEKSINTITVIEYEFNNEYYSQWNWFLERNIQPIIYQNNMWSIKIDCVQIDIPNKLINEFKRYYDKYEEKTKWYLFTRKEKKDYFSIKKQTDFNDNFFIELIKQNKKRHTTRGVTNLG